MQLTAAFTTYEISNPQQRKAFMSISKLCYLESAPLHFVLTMNREYMIDLIQILCRICLAQKFEVLLSFLVADTIYKDFD